MNYSHIPHGTITARVMQSSVALTIVSVTLVVLLTGCSKDIDESPAYQAACHGPPLRGVVQINKAMEDGYEINRRYNCIDKASFEEIEQQRAAWKAANTPEAIARREAEFAAQRERDIAERTRQAAAEETRETETLPIIVLRNVDVNTATEADIADVITIGPELAAKIVEERNKRLFSDWADLANRVVGLSAAQPAVYASVCGLTVNGRSLEGASPDPTMAAILYKKHQQPRSN